MHDLLGVSTCFIVLLQCSPHCVDDKSRPGCKSEPIHPPCPRGAQADNFKLGAKYSMRLWGQIFKDNGAQGFGGWTMARLPWFSLGLLYSLSTSDLHYRMSLE